MHLFTEFSTLTPQPSRARRPQRTYSDPAWPAILAPYEAGAVLYATARREFPDLLTIKTGEIWSHNLSLQTVCAKFGLRPDVPFCVIDSFEEEDRVTHLPAEERYRDGFPFDRGLYYLHLVMDLARLCDQGDQIPSWMYAAVHVQRRNKESGSHAPFTITLQQARDYHRFVKSLSEEADRRHDPCLIESILLDDVECLPYLLWPEPGGPERYDLSRMFSAPVVDRVVDLAVSDGHQQSLLDPPLLHAIEEDLPFWTRCRGVIAHSLCR